MPFVVSSGHKNRGLVDRSQSGGDKAEDLSSLTVQMLELWLCTHGTSIVTYNVIPIAFL